MTQHERENLSLIMVLIFLPLDVCLWGWDVVRANVGRAK